MDRDLPSEHSKKESVCQCVSSPNLTMQSQDLPKRSEETFTFVWSDKNDHPVWDKQKDNVSGNHLVATRRMDNIIFGMSCLNSTDEYRVRHGAHHASTWRMSSMKTNGLQHRILTRAYNIKQYGEHRNLFIKDTLTSPRSSTDVSITIQNIIPLSVDVGNQYSSMRRRPRSKGKK